MSHRRPNPKTCACASRQCAHPRSLIDSNQAGTPSACGFEPRPHGHCLLSPSHDAALGPCGYVLVASGMQLRWLAPRSRGREARERTTNRVGRARRLCASRAMSIRRRGGVAKAHPPQCAATSSCGLAHGEHESRGGVVARARRFEAHMPARGHDAAAAAAAAAAAE